MNASYDIVGVGVPYLDIVVQVDDVPAVNQSSPIGGFQLSGGGKVPTALVAASRLGLSTALVAGIAGDAFGATIREELEREGVSLLPAAAADKSAISVVLADRATKGRTILYSEAEAPETELFAADGPLQAKLLHISASGPAERAAVRWANAKRIPVMLDADYYDPAFPGMAGDVALFIGSEHFFAAWRAELELAAKLEAIREAGSRVVIATLGERGCMVLGEGGLRHVPAFAVEVADTTGAGDVFHGAYAAAYLKGLSDFDSAIFASAVSAMKCRHPGGRAGIPHIEEVKLFLENHYSHTLLF